MGKKKVTMGFRYFLGMHLAICRGPVNSVTRLRFGERDAWTGNLTTSATIDIDKQDLFGGEKKEGGVQGSVDVLMGLPTQTQNAYLQSRLGESVPAFRGVLSLVFRKLGSISTSGGGFYWTAMNPYIKPVAIGVVRRSAGWKNDECWYPSAVNVGFDMNPIHIIVECLTNDEWGMGYPFSILGSSWEPAADQMVTEQFGLSFPWTHQLPIREFVLEVLRHIDATMYVDRSTGLFEVKLYRDDYDPETLQVFDPSNIVSLDSYQRAAWGETVNEVVVEFTDPETGDSKTVTAQDLANFNIQGAVVSVKRAYPGINEVTLANRVAERDLNATSVPLAALEITVNRQAWTLAHGSLFKFTWPDLGIVEAVFRVLKVDYGTLESATIKVHAVEDVFALPDNAGNVEVPSEWVSPDTAPNLVTSFKVTELTYYDVFRLFSPGDLAVLTGLEAYPAFFSARPAPQNQSVNVYASPNTTLANYYPIFEGEMYTPSVDLNGAIGRLTTTIPYDNPLELANSGTVDIYAYWDDEIIHITNINTGAQTLTAVRGVLDTIPQEHADGSRIWLFDGENGAFEGDVDFTRGELSYFRITGLNVNSETDIALATQASRTLTARWSKPWPPANVRIDGTHFPASAARNCVVAWSGRNRINQDTGFTAWTSGHIAEEPGTTYTLTIYDNETNGLIQSISGLTSGGSGGSYTFTTVNAATVYRVELRSTRSGVASEYTFSHVFEVPSFDAALLHFEGAEGSTTFTDDSGKVWTRTGNVVITELQFQHGLSSAYFDGVGDDLASSHASFVLRGDFTVEGWFRFESLATARGVWFFGSNSFDTNRIQLAVAADGSPTFYAQGSVAEGVAWAATGPAGTIDPGVWHHIAAVRDGAQARLYVDGVLVASDVVLVSPTPNSTCRIGSARSGGIIYFTGHVDEFRVRKGEALYTANFTPAGPFTYVAP